MFADDRVVLKGSDVAVTTSDFDRYLTDARITGAKRDRVLAKEGAVATVFENIYIIRTFSAMGEINPAVDQADVDWQVANFRDRLLMKRQLDLEVEAALYDSDWDAVAKEHYTANKADYKTSDRARAAHILISTEDRTPEEAQVLAQEVMVRLQAGDDFNALAREYSDDKSNAENGGDLGSFSRNQMAKPFEDAVFAMTQEGEISEPIETQYGYHIIRFNERVFGRQRGLEEVKTGIISTLKASAAAEARQAQIEALKNDIGNQGLEVNRPVLNEYVLRYRGSAEIDTKKW